MEDNSKPIISDSDMKATISAEIVEIEKYKWYLGEKLGHDPLMDRSMDEICKEWIQKHAVEFREHWELNKRNQCS